MIAFIPSKGRPSTKTHEMFEASGFKVYHFIEPKDFDGYDVKNKINIGADDQGITFVRNFMLDFARTNEIKHFIVCDDDVNKFGIVEGSRAVSLPNAEALLKPFNIFKKSDFALGGINQRQFAWSEKKNYRVNTGKVECCIFCQTDLITWRYKEDTKEDRDFVMQCLDNRQSFVSFSRVHLNMPAIGTGPGGLNDHYQNNSDAAWARKLVIDWPGYAKLIKQYGRTDAKLDYKQKAKDMGLKVI